MKQKIKKLSDKLEKVSNVHYLFYWTNALAKNLVPIQDSSKIEDLKKESENSAILIPKLEESIPESQKLLVEEEKVLEEVIENSKGSSSFPSK